jgi:hypothetical protein
MEVSHAFADTIFDFTKSDHIGLTGWDAISKKDGVQAFASSAAMRSTPRTALRESRYGRVLLEA